MTEPINIAEFLTARLDEREAAATRAPGRNWVRGYKVAGEPGRRTGIESWLVALPGDDINVGDTVAECADVYSTDHIAANDPAFVLADIAAKRAILDEHDGTYSCEVCYEGQGGCGDDDCCGTYAEMKPYPCPTVRLLAAPFSDHPDYDQAWRPTAPVLSV